MMKQHTIPESIIIVLKNIVDKIPDDTIIAYVKDNKDNLCKGGFQPQQKHINLFRNRLKSMLKNTLIADIDHSLLDLLRANDLYLNFTIVLSPEAIEFEMNSFLAYFGKERFLANLLIDKREKVRKLGIEYLKQDDWQEIVLVDKMQAVKNIREGFEPFLSYALPFVENDAGDYIIKSTDSLREKAEIIKQLTIELDAAHNRLAELNKNVKKLESQIRGMEAEIGKAKYDKNKNDDNRKRLAWLEIENKRLIEHNTGLQKTVEESNNRLTVIKNSFYRDELIMKAQGVLENVIMHSDHPLDENIGYLLRLNRTIDLIQCFYLLNRQISDRSEIAQILSDLIKKASEIRQYLRVEQECSHLYGSTFKWVDSATSPDEIDSTCQYLDSLYELKVFTGDEITTLYGKVNDKMDLFYKQFIGSDDLLFQQPINIVWNLKKAIREDSPFLLLLDAYNIMYEMKNVFSVYKKNDVFDKLGKTHLLRIVAGIVGNSNNVHIEVYFDSGQAPNEEQWSKNVKALYSGLPGKHSADLRIIGELEYDQWKHLETPRCLVSNDKDLSDEAFQLGAHIMSVQQFSALFF